MTFLAAVLFALFAPRQDADKKPVDLVKFLDAEKDSIAGDWTIEGGVVSSPKRARPPRIHLLQIPYVPPAEYDLTLVVESRGPFDPKGETTSLDVGLPFGDARTLMVIDGWNGTIGGLMGIRGKAAAENETKTTTRVFTDGTPRTLVFAIRKESLTVTVDGKAIVDWKGSPSDLQGNVYNGEIPDRRAFYLGAWIGYTIRKVEVTPVSGSGTAVARRSKSKFVGGGGGGDFDDTPSTPALLTGIRYWRTMFGASPIVKCVQGLYRGEDGNIEGRVCGVPRSEPNEILASPGYAVGAIVAKGGARVDGFKVVFMRITDKGLDPKDSYQSEWLGGRGGGEETTLGGDGVPVVGLCGRSAEDLDCIGVVQAEVPSAALDPVRALGERLQHADPSVRALAAQKLCRLGADALPVLDGLIDRLKEDSDPRVRIAAARAIGRLGAAAIPAVPALLEGLKHADPVLRSECAASLGKFGPAARPALAPLTEALDSADAALRRSAFLALSALGPETASIARMLHVFRNDVLKDEAVRSALGSPDDWMSANGSEGEALVPVWVSLRAIASMGKEAVPGLAAGIKGDDGIYRGVCGVALAMMGPEARAALPALIEMMQDKDPSLRRLAIKAVQEVDARGPGVFPALKEAARDSDEAVKMLARDAIERLTPLSLRLSTGDRFTTAVKVKRSVDGDGRKAEDAYEALIEYTVVGPAASDPPDEWHDFTAPAQFDLVEWSSNSSPSGAFLTISARFHRLGVGPDVALRSLRETLPKHGWVLDESQEGPGAPPLLTALRRNQRLSVETRQADGTDVLVRIAPHRGGRSTVLESSTDRGPVALRGRILKFKVPGVGIEWDESQGPFPAPEGNATLQALQKVIAAGVSATIDRRGAVQLPEPSLLRNTAFPGFLLSMPGVLPEDSTRKEDRWSTTEGDVMPVLEHRYLKQDAAEIVLSSKASLDRPEANGAPLQKIDGTCTTVFDPRSGLPVKCEGRGTEVLGALKITHEFQCVFTKLPPK